MSLRIEVKRGLGDNPAPEDIVCKYFSTENIFIQRGRVEIDKVETGFRIVTITLPGLRQHVRVGTVIELLDNANTYRAKIKSIQFSVGRDADGTPYSTCSMGLRMIEVL